MNLLKSPIELSAISDSVSTDSSTLPRYASMSAAMLLHSAFIIASALLVMNWLESTSDKAPTAIDDATVHAATIIPIFLVIVIICLPKNSHYFIIRAFDCADNYF